MVLNMEYPANKTEQEREEEKRWFIQASKEYRALEAKNRRYDDFFLFVTHNNTSFERIQRYVKFKEGVVTSKDKKLYEELKIKLQCVTDFRDANPLITCLIFLDDNRQDYTPRLQSLYAMAKFKFSE